MIKKCRCLLLSPILLKYNYNNALLYFNTQQSSIRRYTKNICNKYGYGRSSIIIIFFSFFSSTAPPLPPPKEPHNRLLCRCCLGCGLKNEINSFFSFFLHHHPPRITSHPHPNIPSFLSPQSLNSTSYDSTTTTITLEYKYVYFFIFLKLSDNFFLMKIKSQVFLITIFRHRHHQIKSVFLEQTTTVMGCK